MAFGSELLHRELKAQCDAQRQPLRTRSVWQLLLAFSSALFWSHNAI